ncbi:putative methyltransferase-domain-containing protein [Pilaira anomala]|nr:putative methyltransferase-domain-containing protein [Pilaira anomala]
MLSQDDRDFIRGNRPEGLDVKISEGGPSHLKINSFLLKQDIDTFGLAGKIWQSAYTLQALFDPEMQSTLEPNYIIPEEYYKHHISNNNATEKKKFRILELGAGTGYVGIAMAQHLNPSCQVYITDLEQVVPLIQQNVDKYQQEGTAEIKVDRLHWGNKQDVKRVLLSNNEKFDLVVVSDCVYFPELFEMLLETLLDVCDVTTQVVIGYKCRSLEKEVGFWQDYFGRYFEYEPVRRVVPQDHYDEWLGAEEQLFVFHGKKRVDQNIKPADDTFTTLLFCSMGNN